MAGAALGGPMLVLAGFTVVTNLLMLVMPVYMTQVYDRILPTRSIETLAYLSLMAIAALMLFGLIETLRQTIARRLAARYELAVLPRLITAADDSAAAIDPGAAAKAMTVRRFLGSGAFVNLFDLPFVPLFLGLMFLAHPLLGWLTAAGMVVLVLVTVLNERLSARPGAEQARLQAAAGRSAQDVLSAQEDVRAMGMGEAMARRWRGQALDAALAGERAGAVNARFFGLTRFVRQALQTAALGLGAFLVIHGDMAASLIFAASIVSSRALLPIEQVVGAWKAIAEARRAQGDVGAALALADAADAARGRVELPAPAGHLSARHLRLQLGATPDAPVLVDDVTLAVRPGELAVIVGASGSGKSSLIRLLAGAASPTSGEVRLDGFRLSDWPARTRGRATGYMAQQTVLFEGTVADNIARFDREAGDEAVVDAARRAEAHGFIATLPNGYNTRIGPGGVRLSGGQVQRLALARALYGHPVVLVLDEPNAHLDSFGEEALLKTLAAERARGRAIVVVTHRTNLLAIADSAWLMEGGRLTPMPMPMPMPGAQGRRAQVHPIATALSNG
ncbi:type I secretion system permease/ATPase [Ensifer soli]|uniref:type I secretion system permease/ATPase n=1 Tax=Ciceribacter sp. sgz301302 TaxID=3342379 RepID=UPI0035B9C783